MNTPRIVATLWWIFVVYWWLSAIGVKRRAKGSPRRGGLAIFRAALLLFALILFQSDSSRRFLKHHGDFLANPAVRQAGLVICIAGFAFAIWARRHLGRNWGMPMSLKEGHELITTGPYALVRHPIYTGILLAMVGSVFAAGMEWIVIFAVTCPYFLYSALTEDRLMMEQFPNEYPAYKRKTKLLIPFVF
jgi:protein-S-isoprenylcysteine O-methyltransferase Ste14